MNLQADKWYAYKLISLVEKENTIFDVWGKFVTDLIYFWSRKKA